MAEVRGYSDLSGSEKAAIFILALGEEHSSLLFELMDNEEIRDLSQAMSNLGIIDSSVVERLFLEFADQLTGTGSLSGNFSSTERLLKGSLDPDRAEEIMEELRGPAGRTMWDKLGNVNEAVLANYFKNEYPQTVAVVLSKIKSEHASQVLTLLPEPFAMEVIMRMLRMESVQKEVLDDVERTLRNEFMSNLARTNRRDSHELMAVIFKYLDRNMESRYLAALEELNKASAERIKPLMFTFEDLCNLDPGGVHPRPPTADQAKFATRPARRQQRPEQRQ